MANRDGGWHAVWVQVSLRRFVLQPDEITVAHPIQFAALRGHRSRTALALDQPQVIVVLEAVGGYLFAK